eukprot:8445404-Alexandrium_andersonii.AAC.1
MAVNFASCCTNRCSTRWPKDDGETPIAFLSQSLCVSLPLKGGAGGGRASRFRLAPPLLASGGAD